MPQDRLTRTLLVSLLVLTWIFIVAIVIGTVVRLTS
jgi:hypothetical protein